ncbi:hypothetical protein K438DRAFT_1770481 [Mycena galopus ATCC 62051]|nr:hypothetical protein K438DRAFT_1770481 [Mycena galopus ATCC 62051]
MVGKPSETTVFRVVQRPDPACEVVFGPVNWNKTHSGSPNVKQDILGLIGVVLPTAAHLTFTTRRYGKHEAYSWQARELLRRDLKATVGAERPGERHRNVGICLKEGGVILDLLGVWYGSVLPRSRL